MRMSSHDLLGSGRLRGQKDGHEGLEDNWMGMHMVMYPSGVDQAFSRALIYPLLSGPGGCVQWDLHPPRMPVLLDMYYVARSHTLCELKALQIDQLNGLRI